MGMETVIGMGLLLLGAVCGGCFGLPSKFVSKDVPWETLWGPFFFFVTILIPVTVFPLIADGLFATCTTAAFSVLLPVLIFGLLWGLGSMALGMSFSFIGLSLAYAINYGAQIACGGIGPIAIHHPGKLVTLGGIVILAGVAVCIIGVAVCGKAALLRESSQGGKGDDRERPAMLKGLLIAFISGVLCACFAIAFSFGAPVMELSVEGFGNEGWQAAFVVTALVLWGGALTACGACVYKLCKNRTWGSFKKPGIGKVLLIALIMAFLHDGAILFYGIGASRLGPLGVAVGYAMFMSFTITIGNLNGFLTGEWKGASRRSVGLLVSGVLLLIVGVGVLTKGNLILQDKKETKASVAESAR
jgi:L-rhamnose-H+ transport protein